MFELAKVAINPCDSIIKKIREGFVDGGKSGAKIAAASSAEAIRKLSAPEWMAVKAKIGDIVKISEKDLESLRKKPYQAVMAGWREELLTDSGGEVKPGIRNCSTVVDLHPQLDGVFKFNDFLQRMCVAKEVPFLKNIKIENGGYQQVEDTTLSQLRKWLSHEIADFSKNDIIDAVTCNADDNRFNPLAEALEGFEWDGKPRIDNWLIDFAGATVHKDFEINNEIDYIRRVSAMWLISAVARAFEPGCKVDTMLILEGDQGDKKSSLIEELSMGYFLELTTSLNRTKEVVDLMLGKWLIEMPELRALSGDSDANKAFLTKRSDKERLSYQQFGKDFPRRCVFIGTTNNDDYLKDSTGNRRYWPIKTGACKKDELKKEIPQIWAEAVNRYKAGESWWFKDTKEDKRISDIAEQVQGIKRERDDLEEEVSKYIAPKEDVKSIEIWRNVYNGSNNNFTKDKQMELGRILRVLNWETFSTGGERKWRKRTT